MAGAGVAYPADAVAGSPTYAALDGRNAFSALMGGATAAKPLGGLTGVRPGTPASTVVATTATTWTAQPFSGYIELEASGTNSGYLFAFGSVTSGAIAPAGGSARTDCVWVQIADSNTSDGSAGAPRVIIDYSQATTTPPARAFVIAQINVPATGGGSPTVTWVAPYTAAAGGILPVPAGVYPAASYAGQYIDDPSIGLMRSNGTAFKPVTALASPIIPTVGGSGVSVNASGLVILTNAGASASPITLNGLAGFRKVKIEVKVASASTNNQLIPRVRSVSADDTTTAYFWDVVVANLSTVSAVPSGAGITGWQGFAPATTQTYSLTLELEDLDQAAVTRGDVSMKVFAGATQPKLSQGSVTHSALTAWDGISLTTDTGTVTGTIRVSGII